jgi:hypothetical protein
MMPSANGNSSEPPSQPYDAANLASVTPPVRERSLVGTSLGLAFIFEICPFEADMTFMLLSLKGLPLFLLIKAACLAIILFPLWRYLRLNGRPGATAEKGRIIAIGIILLLKLSADIYMMAGAIFHG